MRSWLRVAGALAGRPALWIPAVRVGFRMVPPAWWRRFPYLPVPARAYVRFRLVTQYGSEDAHVEPSDVLNYVAWCTRQ